MNKQLCIIQARVSSERLPKKVLLKAGGRTLLEHVVGRVRQARNIDKIVVATTDRPADKQIEIICRQLRLPCWRGAETDVLDRYYQCSLAFPKYNNIIRITGDCPLIDPEVIDNVLAFFVKGKFDYASNIQPPTFPDGMDVEVFTRQALALAAKGANLPSEREHVTQYIIKNKKFKKGNFLAEHDWSHIRLTVDRRDDFEVIRFLIKKSKITDGYLHYISVLTRYPGWMLKNAHIIRNEGLNKSLKKDSEQKI